MVRETAVVLALLLSSGAVFGQNEVEDARAAYDAGSSEYDLGHYKDALALFEKAFRLRHVPALLFNIAQCHRMLGELREAATVYRSFIAKETDAKRVGQAREILAQVEDAVARQSQAQYAPPVEASPQAGPLRDALATPDPPRVAETRAAESPRVADTTRAAETTRGPDTSRAETSRAADTPRGTGTPAAPDAKAASARGAEPARAAAPAPRIAEATPPPRDAPARPARTLDSARPAPGAALEERAPAAPKQKRVFTWVAAAATVTSFGVGAALGARSNATKSTLTSSQHQSAEVVTLRDSFVADAHRANALFVAGGVLAGVTFALFLLEF